MKTIKKVLLGFLCLVFTNIAVAQSVEKCTHCKMDIKADAFKTKAESAADKIYYFDAIECLVNYLKTENENTFKTLQVTDYVNGQYIDAIGAHYLKSKGIPSPMGVNLSAFSTKADVLSFQKEKGGEVFTWEQLKEKFVSSNFGAVDHSHHHGRPDAYAPNGIMGDHLHLKGGLMISLRYMNMTMSGNREGSDKITDEAIYDRFMVAPQDMTMQMYMLGVMYAPTDNLTLMLMQNFARKDMDLTARMMMNGGMPMLRNFSTSSSGLGDLKLGLLYGLSKRDKISFHLNIGFNLPVGDIENRDATPMMADAKLPYAMQLGSGTFDVTFGGTLKGNGTKISWGIQQLNIFRTGENNQEYRFGNLHELHSWLGYGISKRLSVSIRLSGSSEGEISGADPELNPMMLTTANTGNYGGKLLRGAVGFNVLLVNNKLILGGELGTPLYQNYNGIFMNEELSFNVGLKYTLL